MKKLVLALTFSLFVSILCFSQTPKVYIAYLWHMHQPIYYPGETIIETQNNAHYGFSVTQVLTDRTGPYTNWPKDAVQQGINAGFTNFGSQVSFSGTLIDNLNTLEGAGYGFNNWKSNWDYIKTQTTGLGNPRIDMVAFGYYHPLMPLIHYKDLRKQIQLHKTAFAANFDGEYSKGMFPPENAFSLHMIPALKDEGIEWVMVDNIHLDRTCENYPYTSGSNLIKPNKSDQLNPDPEDWLQLNNIWAPGQISTAWAHRPHYAQYIDPQTGIAEKIIVVPTSRYLGNEDARGGFGAMDYEAVFSQIESSNTDSEHPILVVLHHDGDNYGGGSDSYYNHNFSNLISWLQTNSDRFVVTSIEDYLEMFPPDENDIINIEPGSWSGADNGDPQYSKWLGEPNTEGYSPDRNSWSIITAATNIVSTAEQISPSNPDIETAWEYLCMGQTSCYWYWDFAEGGLWDSHPARAANIAVNEVSSIISSGSDNTPPTIFLPQRNPYNPGELEWGTVQQPADFTVWSYVYDFGGLTRVQLKWRIDSDGTNSMSTNHNETYAGGSDVGNWNTIEMTEEIIPSQTNPSPIYKANEYSAMISGQNNVLIDYYIEAEDNNGNINKSIIQHVWVESNNSIPNTGVSWTPLNPNLNDIITISVNEVEQGGKLHWGVNDWQQPIEEYWTDNSVLFQDVGPAIQSIMTGPTDNILNIDIGPFNNPLQVVNNINFAILFDDQSWENNNGSDYTINISQSNYSEPELLPNSELNMLKIYPNPANSVINIEFLGDQNNRVYELSEANSYNITITDITGKVIKTQKTNTNKATVQISELETGVYFISASTIDKKIILNQRFMKE